MNELITAKIQDREDDKTALSPPKRARIRELDDVLAAVKHPRELDSSLKLMFISHLRGGMDALQLRKISLVEMRSPSAGAVVAPFT